MKKYLSLFILTCVFSIPSFAQTADTTKHHHGLKIVKNGSFYGSWGYNEETYTNSNLYVVQPSMNNNYSFTNIQAQDHIGWDHLFQAKPTIPQYNYRLGYFFDEKQNWAIELNFDHTKYVVIQGYNVIVNGTLHGRSVDTTVNINNGTLRYQLNNGANFFLFNLVRKVKIFSTHDGKIVLDGLIKVGVGPLIPHVDNTIFGEDNRRQFQIGGWNMGTEATLKLTLFKHIFLEYCNKLDYACYSWLEIYDGRAHQNFGTYENIANIGYTFHLNAKKYPLPAAK